MGDKIVEKIGEKMSMKMDKNRCKGKRETESFMEYKVVGKMQRTT